MRSFREFLIENNRIDERLLQPYQLWIRKYCNYSEREEISDQSMGRFLHWLGGKYSKQQVMQALRALQLYSYYRTRYAAKVGRNGGNADSGSRSTQEADVGTQPSKDASATIAARPTGFASGAERGTRSVAQAPKMIQLPSPSLFVSWKVLEEELVRLMRLKHLSLRTEKTYLA